MADLEIHGDLPYRPRAASGSPSPPQPPQAAQPRPHRGQQKRKIVAEFDRYFGDVSKLENWQRLCADVGIEDDLPSMNQCKKVLLFLSLPSIC
jgi:hypothetical protein